MDLFNFKKRKLKKKRQLLCNDADIFVQVHFVRERTVVKDKYNTLSLKSDPDREACLEWYEKHNNPSDFASIVLAYMSDFSKDDAYMCEKSTLDKSFFSTLKSNKNYFPSKGEAILTAFALKLNLEETKFLLKSAEYPLSNSSKSDLIVRFFIETGNYNAADLNYVLNTLCELKVSDL